MGKCPEISVIMPVYNGEGYLREAIESVLCQTFGDFELIIINDGSTDSSERIIKSFDDGRIVYLRNETNLKLISTLNRGVEVAKGNYIARMDADDRCMPDRFEKQIRFLESHKDIDLCGSWAHLINLQGNRTGRLRNVCDPELISCLLLFTCPLLHPSVMGRASVFKENPYNPEMLHIEDIELWGRLSGRGTAITNIPEYLLEYRWHDSNVSVRNSDFQYRAKCDLLKTRLASLLGREPGPDEMFLHEFSFNLYSKGHKCADETLASRVPDERDWLINLSALNAERKSYPETGFNAVLLSRWIVVCIAFRKFAQLPALPLRFYNPAVVFKAAQLLIQK